MVSPERKTVLQNPGLPSKKGKVSPPFNVWAALQTVMIWGVVVASVFTMWTPANLFAKNKLNTGDDPYANVLPGDLLQPTTTYRYRVSLVVGHWGNDSGAVCPPELGGVQEVDLNMKIASLVEGYLTSENVIVERLKEFDPKLTNLKTMVFLSIHNDSCNYISDAKTGYKVAYPFNARNVENAGRLISCISSRYEKSTGLRFDQDTITDAMTKYHAFNKIDPDTTAAIIETGFMNRDYDLLVNQTNKVARGVADGILCYLRNEDITIKKP